MNAIGDRLREERKRLGLSQTALAQLASASKNSCISWEKGETYPNASDLAAFAEAGADVLYIVTARREPLEARPTQERVHEIIRAALAETECEGIASRAHAPALSSFAPQHVRLEQVSHALVGAAAGALAALCLCLVGRRP